MSHAGLEQQYRQAQEAYERAKVDRWLMADQIAEAVAAGVGPSRWMLDEYEARKDIARLWRESSDEAWAALEAAEGAT